MKYFGKYPIFFILMAVLCLAFVGGAAFDIYYNGKRMEASRSLSGKIREYRKALAEDPTQKTLDKAKANIDVLQKHLDFLQKDLTRSSGDIFKGKPGEEGYQLVEQLRGMVRKWRKDATDLGIIVKPDMDFGFNKYVAPNMLPPKEDAILPIWRQACVLNYINQKLFKCKTEQSPMYILSVQRELLEPEIDKTKVTKRRGRVVNRRVSDSTSGDNFKIDPAITARKEGSLDTIAYRFVFAGHTDVLRRFLNQLKDFDAMLVVRSIGVRPVIPSELPMPQSGESGEAEQQQQPVASDGTNLDSIFGTAPAAQDAAAAMPQTDQQEAAVPVDGAVSEQNRTPVIENNLSEFTVVIEFVELTKDTPKKAAAKDSKGEEATKNAAK